MNARILTHVDVFMSLSIRIAIKKKDTIYINLLATLFSTGTNDK